MESKTSVLTVNDKQPINDDYTSAIVESADFTRNASVDSQDGDIFRVGDILSYVDQPGDEYNFIEVSKVSYSSGVDFISENQSKNSSSIAKYVTKEIAIESPATSIDVRTTVNTSDIENIRVLYRIKKSSSQENFEDIEWVYFNTTGAPDVDVIATSENAIGGITEKQSSYKGYHIALKTFLSFLHSQLRV